MFDSIERKRTAILKILHDSVAPISSEKIAERLNAVGYDVSERTVRLHLAQLDKEGLTRHLPKQGREITQKGRREMSRSRVYERLGFLTAKINQMTFAMSFDLSTLSGTVVVNLSLLGRKEIADAVPLMAKVFEKKLSMGEMMALFTEGEQVGDTVIPEGYVGIGTVCSITINGILLKAGIPTVSRFGGLLEISDYRPRRFVALINYDGTTLDPLEIFIKSGMTDYTSAVSTGSGLIGASFREIPGAAEETVRKISKYIDSIGLHGIVTIGKPEQPVCEIPVSAGCLGLVVIGGLNPIAILEESGIRLDSHALSGLVDFGKLFPYTELRERAARL
jgi:HTH-type transcriptional regulator, global nitrogen regulator NrpRI